MEEKDKLEEYLMNGLTGTPEIKKEEISVSSTLEGKEKEKFEESQNKFDLNQEVSTILAKDNALGRYFESTLSKYNSPQTLANWVANEISKELKEKNINDLIFSQEDFIELVKLVDDDTISIKTAKDIFSKMTKEKLSPDKFVQDNNLAQISDENILSSIIDEVLESNPKNVELYKSGKTNLLGFFLGQTMNKTKGKANPKVVQRIVQEKLS